MHKANPMKQDYTSASAVVKLLHKYPTLCGRRRSIALSEICGPHFGDYQDDSVSNVTPCSLIQVYRSRRWTYIEMNDDRKGSYPTRIYPDTPPQYF
jgi:hypothetical protein